jgi:hypothetical protein
MVAKMDAWIGRKEVCGGKLKHNREKSDAVASGRDRSGDGRSCERLIWGPASSCRVSPTAEENGPRAMVGPRRNWPQPADGGRGHKGPTIEKRRRKGPKCNNGIKNRGARL